MLELAATAPFHAFFGVVVMMSTTLLVGFYSMPMLAWQASPLKDQVTGGDTELVAYNAYLQTLNRADRAQR